jgi:hypothetical protein
MRIRPRSRPREPGPCRHGKRDAGGKDEQAGFRRGELGAPGKGSGSDGFSALASKVFYFGPGTVIALVHGSRRRARYESRTIAREPFALRRPANGAFGMLDFGRASVPW